MERNCDKEAENILVNIVHSHTTTEVKSVNSECFPAQRQKASSAQYEQ